MSDCFLSLNEGRKALLRLQILGIKALTCFYVPPIHLQLGISFITRNN